MNKTTLITNLKFIAFGLVLAGGLTLIHADFAAPTATAPGANIDAPLHTGPDQVKDGGLSVNIFYATQNAAFKQQTFLNGTVFGGGPADATSTVTIGDASASANMVVNGDLSAIGAIKSLSVQNASNSNLCATATGTIVLCGTQTQAGTPPSFTQIGSSYYDNNTDTQEFQVGSSVNPGDVFKLEVYSYKVKVTAVAGDNTESIVEKMITAINNTTAAQWRSVNGGAGVPANGTPGFPPSAQSSPSNPSYIITTIDNVHQMGSNACSGSDQTCLTSL